jgi:hypothetical protein
MSTCLTLKELVTPGERQIRDLQVTAQEFKGKTPEEYCTPIITRVTKITGMVGSVYAIMAQASKRAENTDEVIEIWEAAIKYRDSAARTLKDMCELFPACVDLGIVDEVLRFRSAAAKRHEEARKEKACLTHVPQRLFPEQS